MSSIAHLFVAGGFVMYPLVIFLLFALMIGIERIILYRKFTKDLRRFNKVLEKNQSWVMLPSVLERDTEELGSLFARAMRSAKNYNGLENRLQDVVSYADERLKRGLSWLSMIVTMAPLLAMHLIALANGLNSQNSKIRLSIFRVQHINTTSMKMTLTSLHNQVNCSAS